MIPLSLSIVAIALLVLGIALVFKQSIFFTMIKETPGNSIFLKSFGYVHLCLALISFVVGFMNKRSIALIFLIIMLLISGVFSLILSQKMKAK